MAGVGKREKNKKKTRAKIFETALSLCRELGYERTTVEKITETAGVAKGTFFNYFPTKDALFASYYKELTLEVISKSESQEFSSAREAVLVLTDGLVDTVMNEPTIFQSIGTQRLSSQELRSEEQNLDRSIFIYCENQIRPGCENGELDKDLDVETFIDVLITTMTASGHEWRLAMGDYPLRDKMRSRIEFLFDLATR